jgi:poly(A) polymerase
VLKVLFAPAADLTPLSRMAKIDKAHGFEPDALLRLALIAKDAPALRERLRLTNAEARRLAAIAEHTAPTPRLRERERRVVLYHLGRQTWRDSVRLAWAKSKESSGSQKWRDLLAFTDHWAIPRFPLSGKDLLAQGIKEGPLLGKELGRLEDWWIASDFTADKDDLLSRLNPDSRG